MKRKGRGRGRKVRRKEAINQPVGMLVGCWIIVASFDSLIAALRDWTS